MLVQLGFDGLQAVDGVLLLFLRRFLLENEGLDLFLYVGQVRFRGASPHPYEGNSGQTTCFKKCVHHFENTNLISQAPSDHRNFCQLLYHIKYQDVSKGRLVLRNIPLLILLLLFGTLQAIQPLGQLAQSILMLVYPLSQFGPNGINNLPQLINRVCQLIEVGHIGF